MNGVLFIVLMIVTLGIAFAVDKYLYSEQKPNRLWRVIPPVLFVVANMYLYIRFGFNAFWVRNLWISTLFLISTAEDIRKKELPLEFYVVFALPATILCIAQKDWINPLVAIVVYGIFYMLVRYSKEAIGYGDAAVISLLCLLGGYQTAGVIVLLGLMILGLSGMILIIFRVANRKTEVPFLPFLALSYIIYLFF